ncbi:MAG: hypothetical protein ACRDJF_09290 [Actinomycetota bacterium]
MELYVDVDALSELSRQLGEIKGSLERVSDNVDAYDSRLGSRTLEGALDDFVGGWRDGRKKIIEGIDGLLGRIQGAIDTYLEQEAKLSEATGAKK